MVELLVGLAIGGAIMTVLGGSIFQISTGATTTLSSLDRIHQLQTGIHWLSRDIHQAHSTNIPDGGSQVAVADFDWTEGGTTHSCTYSLVGTDLQRSCDGAPFIVGHSFTQLLFSRQSGLVTVDLQVTDPEDPSKTEEASLLGSLRPS